MQDRALNHEHALLRLPHSHSTLLICDLGALKVPITQLEVLEGLDTSRRGGQNVVKNELEIISNRCQIYHH